MFKNTGDKMTITKFKTADAAEKPKDILEVFIAGKMIAGRMIEAHRDLHFQKRQLDALKDNRAVYFSAASEPIRQKMVARREELFSLYHEMQDNNAAIRAWFEQEYAA